MLPCVHVSVLLARMLTTPTLLFQQPFRVFRRPATVLHTQHTRSSLIKQLPSGMCYLWRVYCRARLGVIFPRDHIMLGWQSSVFRASVQYPSTSVCISWHGRKVKTTCIISRLVPSKKQISGDGATRLIGGASSSNCLSVCLSGSVLFLF